MRQNPISAILEEAPRSVSPTSSLKGSEILPKEDRSRLIRRKKVSLDKEFVRFAETNERMRRAASRCPSFVFLAWRCVESVVL